jgi:hypothetical protein
VYNSVHVGHKALSTSPIGLRAPYGRGLGFICVMFSAISLKPGQSRCSENAGWMEG